MAKGDTALQAVQLKIAMVVASYFCAFSPPPPAHRHMRRLGAPRARAA